MSYEVLNYNFNPQQVKVGIFGLLLLTVYGVIITSTFWSFLETMKIVHGLVCIYCCHGVQVHSNVEKLTESSFFTT